MPLFSIIIPVYNVQNYLSACVKSVVEQPGPRDWECILVDDGSTDQSGAMCDALAAELPGLQVIHRENGGLAAARNTGLKAATGDWLLFLDSDDAMAPGLLAQLRGALAAHPDCDWFIGKHLEWQPDGTLTPHDGLHLVPGPFASSDYAARLKALYTAGHWSVWKYCIRRSFLEQARVRFLPDCVWAEDWPFDLELLLHCDRLYFLDTVFTHYRVGRQGSLLTDAKNLPKRFQGLAAAQRRLARLSANGTADAAAYAAMQDAASDVFWPQARTAAVRDAAIRKACLPYIEQLDMVLVMTVEPGFGGQKFMPSALDKLRWLKAEREKRGLHYLLEVDGGVDNATAPQCVEAGADILVAGSAVFGAADPAAAVQHLVSL